MADSFNAMDHDLEDSVLMREEGNKRQRGDVEGLTGKDRVNFMDGRNKGIKEPTHLLSVAAKRQADRAQ